MIERTLPIDRMENVISVFGSFDQNLRIIETELGVRVTDRDDQLRISGEAEDVMAAEKAINGLLQLASRGEAIDAQNVRYILKLVSEGREAKISELSGDVVCITAKGKPIKAKTLGQKAYVDAMNKNTITLGIGPAGTGKTYLAVAEAVAAFRSEKVNRIILTRPAVEAGERLGFLPGDLQSKVDPYLRPLYDALFEMLGPETYNKYLERGNIEVAPLAYMRGRTLDDSFIILDEAQNTSREQMKMFLTRIGFGSRVVITGDVTQIDLPGDKVSGLKEAMRVLKGIDDIAICKLTGADVVRHELVHLKRRDLWYKALVLCALCVHWFNPLVYWMARVIAADCEMSCDALALTDAGMLERKRYGETILGVIQRQRRRHVALTTYFYEGRKDMKKRFISMLDRTQKRKGGLFVALVLALTLLSGSVLAITPSSLTIPEPEESVDLRAAGMVRRSLCPAGWVRRKSSNAPTDGYAQPDVAGDTADKRPVLLLR